MSYNPGYTAFDVANVFIELAERDGKRLTNMQLQKLVYIAFGYYAGLVGDKLFQDDIQAWNYGPVIPSLYHRLKRYGVGVVTRHLTPKNFIDKHNAARHIIEGVWDSYNKFSAIQLSGLTHDKSTPWSDVFDRAKGKKDVSIPFELIALHYKQLIEDRQNVAR